MHEKLSLDSFSAYFPIGPLEKHNAGNHQKLKECLHLNFNFTKHLEKSKYLQENDLEENVASACLRSCLQMTHGRSVCSGKPLPKLSLI